MSELRKFPELSLNHDGRNVIKYFVIPDVNSNYWPCGLALKTFFDREFSLLIINLLPRNQRKCSYPRILY